MPGELFTAASKALEWLKSPLRWFVLLLISAALLFAPEKWLAKIALLDLSQKYRTVIGVMFLAASAMLCSEIVWKCGAGVRDLFWRWKAHRVSMDYLRNLTPEENRILAEYMERDSETGYYQEINGVVKGLVTKGLLYRGSNVGSGPIPTFAFNLQPWVRHYLKKHPALLQGSTPSKKR